MPPGEAGWVTEHGVDLRGGTACKHAVEGDVVVGVGHQTAGMGGKGRAKGKG